MLVKRTSSRSPSHRRSPLRLENTGLQPVPPDQVSPTALPAPQVLGTADHSHRPELGSATPSQVPVVGPSSPSTEPGSSSMMNYKLDRRRRGSLKNNPALKAQADREKKNRMMERIKSGVLVNRTKRDGSEYTIKTNEDLRAYSRSYARRSKSKLTAEDKEKISKERREKRIQDKERRKAELEGRPWQGPPLRRRGRPRRIWEQEQAGAQEVSQHTSAGARMEEPTTQRAVDDPHAHPFTVQPRRPESSSSSWPSPSPSTESPHSAHHQFAPGPSSSQLDLNLALSAPSSFISGQRQARPPEEAPPAAGEREEERLRLTLAPPGEHDRLRLTLASPRHD